MTFVTRSEQETEQLGEKMGKVLLPGALVRFTGTLGAGKTAFIRGLARGLGYTGYVSSPTFTICNAYDTPRGQLYHFDLYRLSGAEDLEAVGFFDYLAERQFIALEWSERAADILPPDSVSVDLRYKWEESPDLREITITGIEL